MIVVRLQGGLGNQMFQYAAGLALAKQTNSDLFVDINLYNDKIKKTEGFTIRKFELQVFEIPIRIASIKERSPFIKPSLWSRINKKIGLHYPKIYRETGLSFDETFFAIVSPIYIEGYFQSWKYLKGNEDFIRAQFSFRQSLMDSYNRSLINEWSDTNTISVHIRRGDYVTDASINSFHGTCNVTYYEQAIKTIAAKKTDPCLVFFSDDIAWTKETFSNLPFKTIFLDHNTGHDSWKDMMLMSHCRHHIISNSSFSWWGAWLNPNPNKIVIAPKQWFNDPKQQHADLIPADWIQL